MNAHIAARWSGRKQGIAVCSAHTVPLSALSNKWKNRTNKLFSENETCNAYYTMKSQTICYCFGYSEKDIRKDIEQHGRSLIMERIMNEKKDGKCNCAETNPKSRWCLADVRQLVNKITGNKPELKTL